MTTYDNTYNGALFPTPEDGVLSGPFHLPDGKKARIVLERDAHGTRVHGIRVHRVRRNGALHTKPVASGWIRPTRGQNGGPIAKGFIANSKKRVPLVLWLKENEIDGRFYQIKPDSYTERETPPLFDL